FRSRRRAEAAEKPFRGSAVADDAPRERLAPERLLRRQVHVEGMLSADPCARGSFARSRAGALSRLRSRRAGRPPAAMADASRGQDGWRRAGLPARAIRGLA